MTIEEEEQGFIVETTGRFGQQRLSLHPKYTSIINLSVIHQECKYVNIPKKGWVSNVKKNGYYLF